VPLEYPVELDGVTCNTSFCLAVSNTRTAAATFASQVYRSDDGGATWSAGVTLPPAGPAQTRSAIALACDGGDACFAVGRSGGVWRSASGGRSWEALALPDREASYERIDCPAAEVCVAAGTIEEPKGKLVGKSIGSVSVIEGAKVTAVDLPKRLGKGIPALGCDSPTRCVVADGLGKYATLTIASRDWGDIGLFPKSTPVQALSCPKQGECVGLAEAIAMRTTNLGAADTVWKRRPIGSLNLGALSCAAADCVAVGKGASWFLGTELGFDWRRVNEVGKFAAIQCPAEFDGTCVAGGEKEIGVSRTGGKFWSQPLSGEAGLDIKAVECSGESRCLFLGKTQTLFTDDLIAFDARHATLNDPKGTDALTCITHEICVGINEGVVYTTFDGALTDWTQNAFPDKATSVACVHGHLEPAECLATTREFLALGKMTREDGKVRWNWRYTDADPSEALEAVGCSPGGQCTAVGGGGVVLTSAGTDLMHWKELILPSVAEPPEKRPTFKSVACPADGVCLAGGVHGADAIIASTKNNWDDWSYEKISGLEGAAPTVAGFGCESVDRCVAVGSTSLVGTRTPPPSADR
jgi:photosystem II stability/assembly factor-like uncharacterized protein